MRRDQVRYWWWIVALLSVPAVSAVAQQSLAPELPIYVEYSPAARELIDRASRLHDQGRFAQAAGVYQEVIEQYGRKLLEEDPGRYVDAATWVRRSLAAEPELLASYRQLYETIAKRQVDLAILDGRVSEDSISKTSSDHAEDAARRPLESDLPGVAALEDLVARYALCPSGLEAGLRLASLYLEMGQCGYAKSVLDDFQTHPDLQSNIVQWHQLQAAAGLFSDDAGRYRLHLDSLRQQGNQVVVSQLERWSSRLLASSPIHAVDSQDISPAVTLPQPLGVSLWRRPWMGTGFEASAPSRKQHARMNQIRASDGVMMNPTLPVVYENLLYLNEGSRVSAVDKSSGRPIWSFPRDDRFPTNQHARRLGMSRRATPHLRSVLIQGDCLLAVLSDYWTAWRSVRRRGSVPNSLFVCLDRATGNPYWSIEPGSLDQALSNTTFHGTPVSDLTRAYVLVRRNQQSGFQDVYVVAVDLASGKLVWRRHLSSAATNLGSIRKLTLTHHQGKVYVLDNLGAVACLGARSGAVHWLHLLKGRPDTDRVIKARTHVGRSNRQESRPVMTEAGLVIAPLVGLPTAYILDPRNGQVLLERSGDPWSSASYLTAAPGGVLIVGPTVQLIDGKTLDPVWSQGLAVGPEGVAAGRAGVTEDRVLIPTLNQLIVLDRIDGSRLAQYTIDEPGNVLALEEEVIVAGLKSTRGYLSWTRAYEQLRAQMAQDPRDPDAALALAHVALAAGKSDQVVEGFDHALAALEWPSLSSSEGVVSNDESAWRQELQQRVFKQLLEFVDLGGTTDAALRRRLFDRLAAATSGPSDEVAYQLAKGAFLVEDGNPTQAVDHYQAILLDPILSNQLYQHGKGSNQAGVEAKWRLANLMKQYGSEVYARYDTEAASRLIDLMSREPMSAEDLIDLARQYPLARSTPMALLAGADALLRAGDTEDAIGQLRRAYAATHDPEMAKQIISRLALLYEQSGQIRRAVMWLERARGDYRGIRLFRHEQRVSIDQWLSSLVDQTPSGNPWPRLSPPLGPPRILPGRLLTPVRQSPSTWLRDTLITQTNQALHLRSGLGFDLIWDAPNPDEPVDLLTLNEDQVLLWTRSSGTLRALDTQTGRSQWPEIRAVDLLRQDNHLNQEDPPRHAVQRRIEHPRMLNHNRVLAPGRGERFLVDLNDAVICLVDPAGRVAGIDRYTGEVLWQRVCPIDQIKFLSINHEAVALAGQRVDLPKARQQEGTILVLDALTGEPRLPLVDIEHGIRWMQLGDDRQLFYASADRIVARDTREGKVLWWFGFHGQRFAGQAEVGPDAMLTLLWQRAHGTIVVLDPSSGRVRNRVTVPVAVHQAQGSKVRFQTLGDDWYLFTPQLIVSLDGQARVNWRDAVDSDGPKRFMTQLIGDQWVVLLSLASAPVPDGRRAQQAGRRQRFRGRVPADGAQVVPHPDAQWTYHLRLLERQSGMMVRERTLGPLDSPIEPVGVFMDDHLVFTTETQTIVIPGRKRPPSKPGD